MAKANRYGLVFYWNDKDTRDSYINRLESLMSKFGKDRPGVLEEMFDIIENPIDVTKHMNPSNVDIYLEKKRSCIDEMLVNDIMDQGLFVMDRYASTDSVVSSIGIWNIPSKFNTLMTTDIARRIKRSIIEYVNQLETADEMVFNAKGTTVTIVYRQEGRFFSKDKWSVERIEVR